jgi:hypothetical protein
VTKTIKLEAPSGSMAKPWWASRGQSSLELLDFKDFIGLKKHLPRCNFYYVSVVINE